MEKKNKTLLGAFMSLIGIENGSPFPVFDLETKGKQQADASTATVRRDPPIPRVHGERVGHRTKIHSIPQDDGVDLGNTLNA